MNEEIGRVECRLRRSRIWLGIAGIIEGVVLCAGIVSVITTKPRNGVSTPWWFEIFAFCLLFSVPLFMLFSSVYVLLEKFRAYIVADESGLRWRDVRKEHFARWDEVIDFYVDKSSTRKAVIETTQGNIDTRNFSNQEALRAFAISHATNAASREWTTRHVSKTAKWPQFFLTEAETTSCRQCCCCSLFCSYRFRFSQTSLALGTNRWRR